MPTKSFMHVNGTTYELAHAVADINGLAQRLKPLPESEAAQQGPVRSAQPVQIVDVRIDGERVSLTVCPDRVWASSAWNVEEPDAQQSSVVAQFMSLDEESR